MKERRQKRHTPDNFPLSGVGNSAINCKKAGISVVPHALVISEVHRFLEASLAINTRKAYYSDLTHYERWGGRIPSSPEAIAKYLAQTADSFCAATLSRRLVAIGQAHLAAGFANPTRNYIVRMTMRGICRSFRSIPRRVEAFTVEDIKSFAKRCESTTADMLSLAIILIGFAGALRRSELAALEVEALTRVPNGLRINIPISKTDQFGRGRSVFIPKVGGSLCPVKAIESWMDRANIRSGAIFRPINRLGEISSSRISVEAIALTLKRAASRIGRDPRNFSGHSLRAGFVTSAAQHSIPMWQIRRQTGHSSYAMLYRYIRSSDIEISNNWAKLFCEG